jgi:hypothetical protein
MPESQPVELYVNAKPVSARRTSVVRESSDEALQLVYLVRASPLPEFPVRGREQLDRLPHADQSPS